MEKAKEFVVEVETNNTSLAAGYSFPRTAINTFIPTHQFCGQMTVEVKAVLEFKQIGLLIAKTLARHGKDEGK